MLQVKVAIILFATATIKAEEHNVFFKIEEGSFCSSGISIWEGVVDSLMSCSLMCARQAGCNSANFVQSQRTCSLFGPKQTQQNAKRFSQQQGAFYLEKVAISKASTSLDMSAVPSCQTLLKQSPHIPSGVYWIDPDGGSQINAAFKAYCDMETDGGGWTLVWSYTFTNDKHFKDNSNAITPRPNWPVNSKVDVPISTTPPFSETDYNAIKFSLWKQLGKQVLIKSNINNWLKCDPVNGSLVDWINGTVNCQIIKQVTETCKNRPAPSRFAAAGGYGPRFNTTDNMYYYFDGYKGDNWPTHDPCGRNQVNHVKNVVNPHGNIFIRKHNTYVGTDGS